MRTQWKRKQGRRATSPSCALGGVMAINGHTWRTGEKPYNTVSSVLSTPPPRRSSREQGGGNRILRTLLENLGLLPRGMLLALYNAAPANLLPPQKPLHTLPRTWNIYSTQPQPHSTFSPPIIRGFWKARSTPAWKQ